VQLQPFRLERYYDKREFTARYMMSASDCESWTVAELTALDPNAGERLLALSLGYTHTAGHPVLRSRIASLYATVRPDEIIAHAGAQEAVFTFMNAALEPGDHVIVHHPAYQSLAEIPRALGCEVTPWRTSAAEQWALDPDVLRRLMRPRTKAIVINIPHSPTGWLPSASTLDAIVAIAREHGILLFSDEVYRGLEYDERDRLPAVVDLYERGVSLGVMSKAYGLAGLRIGWLAVRDRALAQRVCEIKDYTTICSSAPSECLAMIALAHHREILDRNLRIIRHNLADLHAFLDARPAQLSWVPPRAGPVAMVEPAHVTDIEDYCDLVLERTGVLLLPGTVFDESNRGVRIGFGRRSFPDALDRYAAFVGQPNA
jgi:aspartate/methionine/tyrosine aminotransferase